MDVTNNYRGYHMVIASDYIAKRVAGQCHCLLAGDTTVARHIVESKCTSPELPGFCQLHASSYLFQNGYSSSQGPMCAC